jgi:myosin-crossreactive antigen
MIEFGYESMFKPIYEHLGKHHCEYRLKSKIAFRKGNIESQK